MRLLSIKNVTIAAGLLLAFLVILGYIIPLEWIGVSSVEYFKESNKEIRPFKTLWDWMQLLIIPIALVFGGFLLNRAEKTREIKAAGKRAELDRKLAKKRRNKDLKIAALRNEERVLSEYFDRMSELIIDKDLLGVFAYSWEEKEKNRILRDVARTRTLSVLKRLTKDRVTTVINFLKESKLVSTKLTLSNEDIIDLRSAILAEVDFSYIDLSYLHLDKASFQKAKLKGAILNRTSLDNADLTEANLQRVYCKNTSFKSTNFFKTIFINAHLCDAQFDKNYMSMANFNEADLYRSSINQAYLENAQFERSHLRKVKFHNSKTMKANFKNANLTQACFQDSDLTQANFNHANLIETKLDNVNLSETNFANVFGLSKNQLSKCYYINKPPINIPEGINPPQSKTI